MRSQKRRALVEKRKKSGKMTKVFVKFMLAPLIILLIVLFFKLSETHWDGNDKFAVSYRKTDGNVAVTVLDPKLSENTTIIIPGDTQVEVARNYGTLRIKNVWQLGNNEKLGGGLLAETITQNFMFPVFLWSDSSAEALGNGSFSGLLHFIFSPGSGNIGFGDRVMASFFAFNLGPSDTTEINLAKSQFLSKVKLNDGEVGYILSAPISQRLTSYFSETSMADGGTSIEIVDATGVPGVADNIGQVLEVMGGKVVSINKKVTAEASDCNISGTNKTAVKKVANLFHCKIIQKETNLGVSLEIGSIFAKRY